METIKTYLENMFSGLPDTPEVHSLESGNGICQHDLVGVSNVRLAGSVSNGRGDVIRFLHGVFLTFCRRSGLFFHSDAICAAQI